MTRRIKYLTLTEQVVSVVKEKIYNGEYLPEEHIVESNIAEELGISRGPIRDALKSLEYEGLIKCYSNKGCYVRKITYQEIMDSYSIRASLESLAINFWDWNQDKENVFEKMQQIVNKMAIASEERNIGKLVQLDEDFHAQIVLASENKKIYEVWSVLKNVNILTFVSTRYVSEFNFNIQSSGHQKILDTLRTGHISEIKNIIKDHYKKSVGIFKQLEGN